MELLLFRHGIAEDAHAGLTDYDRALTPKGRDELARIARGMRRLKLAPDAVLSSPLVRARQTAELVAPVLGREVEIVEALASGADWEDFAQVIEQRSSNASLMLVGHEPDLSMVAALLIGAPETILTLKKAGLIRISLAGPVRLGGGDLRWLLTPHHLALLGDAR